MNSELTKQFKMVHMNEIGITNNEYPIIGTQGLGPCVAFLVYSEKHKKAIVAHIPDDTVDYFTLLIDFILAYNLSDSPLKYAIIEGYYKNGYNVKEKLEQRFLSFKELFVPFEPLKKDAVNVDNMSTSHEFAFNSFTGEFVTNQVSFGYDYNNIHSNKI